MKNFSELIYNLKIIFKDKKMLLFFLIFLPVIFYVVRIQIFVGFIFSIIYVTWFFIIYSFLKTKYTISCVELPVNTSRVIIHSIFNIFIFIPKSKGFITVYNILEYFYSENNDEIKNNKIDKFIQFIVFLIIFLIIFLIKFSIFLILGYTFLSLLITSELTIKCFSLINLNYRSKKSKIETFIINCFLDGTHSVGKADEMNIIIDNGKVIFNMKDLEFLAKFAKKVKNFELLQKAFKINNLNMMEKKYVNGHYTYSFISKKYKNMNLTKNFTSGETIKVFDENNLLIRIFCKDAFQPNLLGQNKQNFLTPTYELKKETAIVDELQPNVLLKMQKMSNIVYNSIMLDANQQLMYLDDQIFYLKENSPLIKEYAKEAELFVYTDMATLEEFLNIEENKEFFQTPEGKLELSMAMQKLSNLNRDVIFDKSINKFTF